MADTTISALTELTVLADDDLLVVDDASAAVGEKTKKVTLATLADYAADTPHVFTTLDDVPAAYAGAGGYTVRVKADESGLEFKNGEAYGGLYVSENLVPQSVGTVWEQFVPVGAAACASENVTLDEMAGSITILQNGNYDVFVGLSFSGANAITFEFSVAVNGIPSPCLMFSRKMGPSGDIGTGAMKNVLALSAGDVLTTVVMADSAATDIIMRDGQFNVHRISH